MAQAELEDRDMAGAYHRIRFGVPDRVEGFGEAVEIETTRPELIPACVALVAHPDDERYKPLFGKEVVTPLFGVRVPVKAHALADPEKGSGIAMICTFGDIADVTWWRELSLPVRAIIQPDGTLRPVTWGAPGWESVDADRAQRLLRRASAAVGVEGACEDRRAVEGSRRPCRRAAPDHACGEVLREGRSAAGNRDQPAVVLQDDGFREALLERGRELKWHPAYMQARYENWVNGLNGDWCVSRQRFFGVPFPIWYPIGDSGRVEFEKPIAASEEPGAGRSVDRRAGRLPSPSQRGVPGGFVGDPDVMDTWATSSLSPQIVCGWPDDPELFARTFPMDMRPQAHDIIRTWLFSIGAARAPRAPVAALVERGDLRVRHSIPTARRCRSRRATW